MTGFANNYVERSIKSIVDWWLVAAYFILVLIGWFNVYASGHGPESVSALEWAGRSGKQLVWILSAFALAVLILFVVKPMIWEMFSVQLYGIVLILLIAVIFIGAEIKGSRSWFQFGAVSFQPAEISKITTSLLLSAIMSRMGFKISRRRNFLLAALIVILPMLVIVAESETGTALVYLGFAFVFYTQGMSGWVLVFAGVAISIFILTLIVSPWVAVAILLALVTLYYFLAVKDTRKKSLARRNQRLVSIAAFAVGLLLVFSTDFVFNNLLQDHQRKRIEVLLGMKEDPSGVGYNVRQSMIAIGSGGLTGKGYLNGTQTTYGFVPEQSTDFIFCTIGEEWGFLGCTTVILLYVFLICRIVRDAQKCREKFTQIYGYCVASIFFMHLFINVGMTIGLMPVIGIPLPLISYGGSSLWSFTILLFIFIALYRQEKKYF